MTAAALCEDGRIAYIADYPVYGAVANINAFAIGSPDGAAGSEDLSEMVQP